MNTIRRLGQLPLSTLHALGKNNSAHDNSDHAAELIEAGTDHVEDANAAALEQAFDTARDRGFEQGMQDAQREIDRRFELLEKKLNEEHAQRVDQLAQERKLFVAKSADFFEKTSDWLKHAEQLAIEAAYASLLRIMGEAPVSEHLIASVCKKVVREHANSSATLRLSEEDASSMNLDDYGLSIEIDPALEAGQFILESVRGDLQSGIDVRLEAMKQAYLDSLSPKGSA